MASQATISRWNSRQPDQAFREILQVLIAVFLLSLLAQVTISISGTPVPITGQTFGVTLLSLLMGWARAGAVMSLYIAAGMMGAPVFADAGAGPELGASAGYLAGMVVAAVVMGVFADRGAVEGFTGALGAAFLGTLLIFALGVAGLSLYLPGDALLSAGVLPFVPGAVLKLLPAAVIACWLNRRVARSDCRC